MNKEVIVVVLDGHVTMNKPNGGGVDAAENDESQVNPAADDQQKVIHSRFDVAKSHIKKLLTQKMMYSPASHEFGMVLYGTDETNNALADKTNHGKNVSTVRQLSKIEQSFVRQINSFTVSKHQQSSDFIDGLDVAIDMIDRHCEKRKYKKRVFLITDGESATTKNVEARVNSILGTLQEKDIRLNVIAMDFAHDLAEVDEHNSEEEPSEPLQETATQTQNRSLFELICDNLPTRGKIFHSSVADAMFSDFAKREIMTKVKYKGALQMGSCTNEEDFGLNLQVQVYSRTREEVFPSLKKYSRLVPDQASADVGKIRMDRQYAEFDDAEQKAIDKENIQKAFLYGKQLVPVNEGDEKQLKLNAGDCAPQHTEAGAQDDENGDHEMNGNQKQKDKSPDYGEVKEVGMGLNGDIDKQFKMLGFTPADQVPRHHYINGVDVVLPMRGSQNERAFAAIVSSMIETKKVMVAKIVEKANADPKLVTLHPHVEGDQPLLYLVQMPTSEDLREYQFPKLVASTNEQRQVASDFVDALDLDVPNEMEENDRFDPENIYNPALQYLNQVVRDRISNDDDNQNPAMGPRPLPEIEERIVEYLRPDAQMFQEAEPQLSAFEQAFELIPNEEEDPENKKQKTRVFWKDLIAEEEQRQQMIAQEREAEKLKLGDGKPTDPNQDPNAPSIPQQEKAIPKEVGNQNPIADFLAMVNDRKVDRVNQAIQSMQKYIIRLLDVAMEGDTHSRAFECLKNLREICVREDEGHLFNAFMRYKIKMNSEFFKLCIDSKIGLVTEDESPISSTVSQEQANEFLTPVLKLIANGNKKN